MYHQQDVTLEVHDLQADHDDDFVVISWSDAALANRVDLSSSGGMFVALAHRSMVDHGVCGPLNLVSWSSAKLRRVCRSSLAAETQALAECEQEVMSGDVA